jgi:hypothetical protein
MTGLKIILVSHAAQRFCTRIYDGIVSGRLEVDGNNCIPGAPKHCAISGETSCMRNVHA